MNQAASYTPTSQAIQVLASLDFERQAPGTIVQDFAELLELISDDGIPLTPTDGLFAMGQLERINQRLSRPVQVRLKRPMQKAFPPINGLFLLLRASGLTRVETRKKTKILVLEPQALESWRSLNAAERYFALLSAWWGRATGEIVGERSGLHDNFLIENAHFIEKLMESGRLHYASPMLAESALRHYPGYCSVALMDLFGFVVIDLMPAELAKGWIPSTIQITELGQALMYDYLSCCRTSDSRLDWILEFGVGFGTLPYFQHWSQVIRPHIPQWQHDLTLADSRFQPGPHVLKVSLRKDCWRRIAVPGETSLDELAYFILDAFKFDYDHLYSFSYKDSFGRTVEVMHPGAFEIGGEPADDVPLGELPLYAGMHMLFAYDFGDNWEFDIEIEAPPEKLPVEQMRILEKVGRSPKQYS